MTDPTTKLAELVREQQTREAELEELGDRARAGQDVTELERRLGVDAELVARAFEPLSDEAQARITAAIQRSLPASSTHLSRRSLGRMAWLGPVLAAAMVALWLWPSELPMLEEYELQVSGGVAQERSAPPALAPLRLLPGSTLVMVLRPEHAPAFEVTAHVYLRSAAEELALPASIERAESGTLRLRVALGSSLPASGELIVLVGTPTVLDVAPSAAQVLKSQPSSGPGWQRVTRAFTRVASPP